MIKFFRNIRKNLLKEGKTANYLKYAIGEIVLVVIGILLALQVNNWNTQRINNLQEKEILIQLRDEYQNNLTQLNQKIAIRDSIVHSSIKLLSYRKELPSSIETDSFNKYLIKLYSTPTFDPALGVSYELSNSGKLYLIQDRDLRNLITTWPSYISQLQEEEVNIKEWVESRFIPFLIKNYQIGSSIELSFYDESYNSLAALSQLSQQSLAGLFDKVSCNSLLYHPDFEDYLALEINNNLWANRQSVGVKSQLEKIIISIDTELKKKME
jgi:hypothetical protein